MLKINSKSNILRVYFMEKIDKSILENALAYIGKTVDVIIDRPLGSCHPEFKDMIYQINYGYIPFTSGGDGEEIDVYIIDYDKPLERAKVKIIAVINRFDDNEQKLVGSVSGKDYTDKEIKEKTLFTEKYFKSEILRG